MGAWGVGLYSSDLTNDLKGTFRELVRVPMSDDELVEALLDAYPAGRDNDDEDYTDFWLALADLFHAYGFENARVRKTAREIIATDADLDMKRALEQSASDLRKRERLLADLAEKWSRPHPKPRARRLMKAPEPLLFEPGDCVVFPTHKGNAAPAFKTAKDIDAEFEPDGWGAFVVLATARRYGYFATYLVARLHVRAKNKPTLEDCAGSVISAFHMGLPYVPRDPMVKVTATTRAEVKKLRLEKMGRFELDDGALRQAFPERYETLDAPSWSLPGLLRPYGEGIAVVLEHPVPMKKLPVRRFLT